MHCLRSLILILKILSKPSLNECMNWLKDNKIRILLYACVLSLAALVILFGIRIYAPILLDIDIKWLVVAAIPIILALIVGRFVAKFKWGGIDIELAAEGKIIDHEEVFVLFQPFAAQRKDDLNTLRAMSETEKGKPNALLFDLDRSDYYDANVIREYVRELRNVRFFIIRINAGQLVAIIYIDRSIILNQENEYLYRFIEGLPNRVNSQGFGTVVGGRISVNERIVDAYQKMKREKSRVLLVFAEGNTGFPMGFITMKMAERYLANLVVRVVNQKSS
jgi:hypothetical protein